MIADYPRDLKGYGEKPPIVNWPGKARIAVQFVINYDEGGENCVLHGDDASEAFLSEIVGAQPMVDARHMNMESIYEYGSRVGFWRLHRLFTARKLAVTVFGVATAMERNPEAVEAMLDADWEIASHGYKWIDYQNVEEAIEREHIVPYTLDANDMRFATNQGFNSGDQFFSYLKDSFDVLRDEGIDAPKMMSIGLHCRLIGRPGRVASLIRFLDYIASFDDVWVCSRSDIAKHWVDNHPT